MSTLGLVAVILLAVVVALFVVLGLLTRRRNGSVAVEQQPRTVADLVRLRAEETARRAATEAPTARVVTVPVVEPEAPTVELVTSDPIADSVTRPLARPRSGPIAGPSGRLAPLAAPVTPTEPAQASSAAASVEPSRAGDTPWGRAARVANGESTFWAPEGAEGVPDEPEPARPAAPVWVAPERAAASGHTDREEREEVDAAADQEPSADEPSADARRDDDTPAPPTEPIVRGIARPAPAAHDAVWTPPEAMKESAAPKEPEPAVSTEPAPEPPRPFAVVQPVDGNGEPTPPRPFAVVPPVPAAPRPLAVVPPLPTDTSDAPDDQRGEGTEDAVVVTFPAAASPPPAHAPGGQPTGPDSSHQAEPPPHHASSTPAPPHRPAVTPPAAPPPLGPVDVVSPPAPGLDDGDGEAGEEAQVPLLAAAFSGALGARTTARPRRSAAETAAEQAAADLALLRTFGFSEAGGPPDGESMMSPGAAPDADSALDDGAAQLVRFHVVGRDGAGVGKASVALLDDRGRESATAVADVDGRGELRAPHAGSYMIVSTAADHQPGAVAITVADGPADVDVLLARSAALTGTVFGEDGPVVGARLTLVQDGEIVDSVASAADGTYRITDLAAGEYGLSVSAVDCEPVAVLIDVQDETELHHDVDLEPAGIPSGPEPAESDDIMIGHH